MKKITAITMMLLSLWVSVLFTACDKEKVDYGVAEEQGELSFAGLSFTVNTEVATKAESTDSYKVGIYDSNNLLVGEKYTYSALPKVIALKVGSYKVVVQSGETMEECGDIGFYSGSQTFEIKKNKVTDIDKIVCTLANTKVSVDVDETLAGEIQPDYQVQVSNGGTGIYSFTEKDITDKKIKYFKTTTTKKLEVVLIGKRPDGQIVRESSVIGNVQGGEWRKVKVSVIQTGTLKSALQIDTTLEEIKWDVKVPVEDDIIKPDPTPDPDPEDPDPTPDPNPDDKSTITIEGVGFSIDNEQVIPEGGSTIKVNMTASEGINKLEITIDSSILTEEELGGVGLAKHFDLADPGDLASSLSSLGFPVGSQVSGKKSVSFDITEFTNLLYKMKTGKHNFAIAITDTKGKVETKTLTLVVK